MTILSLAFHASSHAYVTSSVRSSAHSPWRDCIVNFKLSQACHASHDCAPIASSVQISDHKSSRNEIMNDLAIPKRYASQNHDITTYHPCHLSTKTSRRDALALKAFQFPRTASELILSDLRILWQCSCHREPFFISFASCIVWSTYGMIDVKVCAVSSLEICT
jgi:hypothetical protein